MPKTFGIFALTFAGVFSASMVPASALDDSDAARLAAIARLRAAPASAVCADPALNSRSYGTSCESREFRAPAIVEAPRIRWEVEFGWWGTWSPWIGEGLMLTGSCNNDTNKGLSAIDMQTGKVRWRNSAICDVGARAGTTGNANFQEYGRGKVFFGLSRVDGKPVDLHIVDLKTGRIIEMLAPVKRGPTNEVGGVFTVITASKEAKRTYLNVLSPKMDRIEWRQEMFNIACDRLDGFCRPIFSRSASSNGMLFIGASNIDQIEPATRETHAFDLTTGALRWRHTAQPIEDLDSRGRKMRSDDGNPMIVDGKVIIRLKDENSYMLRALDAASGRTLWTTDPQPRRVMETRGLLGRRELQSWIGAGPVIVAYFWSGEKNELMAWRASDGRLLWTRDAPHGLDLAASSGGAFYTAVLGKGAEAKDDIIEGFEAATGTRLWRIALPTHNRPFTGQWSITDLGGSGPQGPSWRIGPDGAIYGVTLKGAYKLQ